MSEFLTRRGRTWHFVRRVPAEFAGLDPRGIIRHSTRVPVADDRVGRRAARVAHTFNLELERFWKGLADGESSIRQSRHCDAQHQARALYFDYIPNELLIAAATEVAAESAHKNIGQLSRMLTVSTRKPASFSTS